jgi:hypothetical protein
MASASPLPPPERGTASEARPVRVRTAQACFALSASALALFESCCFADAQQLKCEIGPVQKTYGSTQWLIYSCQDSRSLVIITAPGNPAMPFYFLLHPSDDGYRIEGEGTGNKDITDRVLAELQRLSASEIAALISATRDAAPAKTQ